LVEFQGFLDEFQGIFVIFLGFKAGCQRLQGYQGLHGFQVGFQDICTPDFRSSWTLVGGFWVTLIVSLLRCGFAQGGSTTVEPLPVQAFYTGEEKKEKKTKTGDVF